jgi:hypothetical protein
MKRTLFGAAVASAIARMSAVAVITAIALVCSVLDPASASTDCSQPLSGGEDPLRIPRQSRGD